MTYIMDVLNLTDTGFLNVTNNSHNDYSASSIQPGIESSLWKKDRYSKYNDASNKDKSIDFSVNKEYNTIKVEANADIFIGVGSIITYKKTV